MKTNLRRIAIKIDEYEKGEEKQGRFAIGLGKFTITDMIRATLTVKSKEEFEEAYGIVHNMEGLNIIKIKNKICTSL